MGRIILLLLLSVGAFAQSPRPLPVYSMYGAHIIAWQPAPIPGYTKINARYQWIAGAFDSTLSVPYGATASLRTLGYNAPGALFFQTSDSSLYAYTGTQWRVVSGGGGWLTTGNSGTTAGTNFIGTTDAVAVVVKTNNTERARVLSGGNVGIGTSTPDSSFHVVGGLKFVTGRQAAGEILMSDAGGGADWVMPTNGITSTSTSLKLGGSLVENTTINAKNYFARIDSATSMRFTKYRSADSSRSVLDFPSGSTIGFDLKSVDDENGLGGYTVGVQTVRAGDGIDLILHAGQGSSVRTAVQIRSEDNSFYFITDSIEVPNIPLLTSISDTSVHKPLVVGSDNLIKRLNFWPSGGGSGVTTLATFGAGARLPGDTAAFTDSTIYGSFYNDGEDTLVITAMRIVMQGTNDTLTINVEWNDSLNTTGTKLKTAYAAANNNYTGNSYTSFDNTKIPPGNHVWCKSPTVIPGRRPNYLSVTLIGYKKRV